MSDYEIAGPFVSHRLIVDGRRVPHLEALPVNGGKISLILDHRYAVDIDVAQADALIPWIANAIAVAMGYTCHPSAGEEPLRSTPFQPTPRIDWKEVDPAG